MNKNIPQLIAPGAGALNSEAPPQAVEMWNYRIVPSNKTENEIDIFGDIGESFFSEGNTIKEIKNQLKSIGKNPVTVNINSPGGSLFEGVAIYNAFRSHESDVTMNVIGIAASAAALIVMAGTEIKIAPMASMMIHNTQIAAFGDRNFLQNRVNLMSKFDQSLVDMFAKRTNNKNSDVTRMMDLETWFVGDGAVEKGFADSMLDPDQTKEDSNAKTENSANWRKLDARLASIGMSRKNRRKVINDLRESEKALYTPKPGAGDAETLNAFGDMIDQSIKKIA